jgi:hypothetical protein
MLLQLIGGPRDGQTVKWKGCEFYGLSHPFCYRLVRAADGRPVSLNWSRA